MAGHCPPLSMRSLMAGHCPPLSMALLTMRRPTVQAERLFDELRAHPTLRADVTAYNVALKGRLARRDAQGALQPHTLSTGTQPRPATPPGRHATRAYTMPRALTRRAPALPLHAERPARRALASGRHVQHAARRAAQSGRALPHAQPCPSPTLTLSRTRTLTPTQSQPQPEPQPTPTPNSGPNQTRPTRRRGCSRR